MSYKDECKILLRDTLLVFISVIMGLFIVEQLKIVKNKINDSTETTNVFIDNPDF